MDRLKEWMVDNLGYVYIIVLFICSFLCSLPILLKNTDNVKYIQDNANEFIESSNKFEIIMSEGFKSNTNGGRVYYIVTDKKGNLYNLSITKEYNELMLYNIKLISRK